MQAGCALTAGAQGVGNMTHMETRLTQMVTLMAGRTNEDGQPNGGRPSHCGELDDVLLTA